MQMYCHSKYCESDEEHRSRLGQQRVGSRAGAHIKTIIAQESTEKQNRRRAGRVHSIAEWAGRRSP